MIMWWRDTDIYLSCWGTTKKDRPQKDWYQVVDSDLRSLKIDHDLVQIQSDFEHFMTSSFAKLNMWILFLSSVFTSQWRKLFATTRTDRQPIGNSVERYSFRNELVITEKAGQTDPNKGLTTKTSGFLLWCNILKTINYSSTT